MASLVRKFYLKGFCIGFERFWIGFCLRNSKLNLLYGTIKTNVLTLYLKVMFDNHRAHGGCGSSSDIQDIPLRDTTNKFHVFVCVKINVNCSPPYVIVAPVSLLKYINIVNNSQIPYDSELKISKLIRYIPKIHIT